MALPFAAAFTLFKYREQADEKDYSVTAIVAALLVFGLGAYAMVGSWRVAAAAAVVTTALLALKAVLHGWLQRLTWPELRSALILLAMSFVALPLLPDQGFGPYDSVNPHELWLLTIALAGVSFCAYAAIRITGPRRGTVLGAVAGALVSSTAVTLDLARREKAAPAPGLHASAALLAGAVMAVRICVIAGAVSPSLLREIALPLGVFAAASAALSLAGVWRKRPPTDEGPDSSMKSPFDLGLVLKFALVLGVVMAAARIFSALYGARGLLPVAAVAGLVDADAVTLATARMTTTGLAPQLGAYAVFVAAGVDSVSKTAIATVVGGRRMGAWLGLATLAAAGLAAAVWWAV